MYANPFIDETFDINNCENYILSIQCALDGFSFSIIDTTVDKFIVLSNYNLIAATPFELKVIINSIIQQEAMLQKQFKKVKICFVSEKIILIPESLFDKNSNDIFYFSFDKDRDEQVITNYAHANQVILSAIPQSLKLYFETIFPNCQFYTPANPIINYSKNFSATALRIFVTKFNHTLQIIVFKNENIEFLNSFFVKNDDDCLYYILNSAKNLNANIKTEIVISGKMENQLFLTKSLKNYFEKVNTAHFSTKYAVSYTFMVEPDNNHLPLLELALCE